MHGQSAVGAGLHEARLACEARTGRALAGQAGARALDFEVPCDVPAMLEQTSRIAQGIGGGAQRAAAHEQAAAAAAARSCHGKRAAPAPEVSATSSSAGGSSQNWSVTEAMLRPDARSWSSRTITSLAPCRSIGAGRYSAPWGPIVGQYRPRLWPFTQT
mmetsp:Transcript_8972/g.23167  ORF Transcript_8972/g.23167 Transcript_8972/m.23167 type:complete len:159 (-) Transcript_8972:1657-2133(-)